MDSNALTQLFFCFSTLSALLLIGTFLRSKVLLFRKLFLPASVIGGFVGLFIGPIIWGSRAPIPIPLEWISTWSALPGILIIPVVASVPLGMKVSSKAEKKQKKTSANIIKMFAIIAGVTAFQGSFGLMVQAFFRTFSNIELYPTFGYELPNGFAGGHGTAGVIGNYYHSLDLPFWEIAQGVTTTVATFGLIGGMLIGIIYINIAARRGKTSLLDKPEDIPEDIAKGYQLDVEKQNNLGKETTMNSSIESLTFHLSIILVGCGLSFLLMGLIKYLEIPGIKNVPIWAYAIVVMFGVNYVFQKTKLKTLIDTKTKSRIAGVCSDYSITAAIASLPVQAILTYLLPILVLVVLGLAFTFLWIYILCKKSFNDFVVERSVACFGTCTGVFLTGIMLLKICDPEFESPVLQDYSVGFSLTSVLSFVLLTLFVNFMLIYNVYINIGIQFSVFLIYMVLLAVVKKGEKQFS